MARAAEKDADTTVRFDVGLCMHLRPQCDERDRRSARPCHCPSSVLHGHASLDDKILRYPADAGPGDGTRRNAHARPHSPRVRDGSERHARRAAVRRAAAGRLRGGGAAPRHPVGVPGVEEVRGSVTDAGLVEQLVSRSDAVLHLATCKEDREALVPVSVQGTFNLLEAAKRTATPKRVVLASGDAVNGIYFNPQPFPIHEGLPVAAYPATTRSRRCWRRPCSSGPTTRSACPPSAFGCRGFTPKTTSSTT